MKKIYSSIFITIFTTQIANAQLTLTNGFNAPIIGDTNKAYLIDTGLVNIKSINAVNGNNANWNYSALTILSNSITSTPYTATTSASSASNYPGCDIVQSNSSYLKSVITPSAQTELLGTAFIGASLNFTNSAIVAKYPFANSNTFTDSYSGTVTYTSNGTFSGSVTVIADGTGTLTLPGGQLFTNVLRVKSYQSTSVLGIIPFLPITIKITNYDYYHASQKYPVFNVNYTSITILTPTVSGSVRANYNSTIVGINENTLQNNVIKIYPNPISSVLCFELASGVSPKKTTIYNQLGSVIYNDVYNLQLNISQLEAGIYFIEIETDKGIFRKKIIKD